MTFVSLARIVANKSKSVSEIFFFFMERVAKFEKQATEDNLYTFQSWWDISNEATRD